MVIISLGLALIFLFLFIVSAKNGQFDDSHSPAVRMLIDDKPISSSKRDSNNKEQIINNGITEV